MPTQKLTAEIITAAIEGFESQKQRLDSKIDELRQLLHGDSTETAEPSAPGRRRKMSAAGRRRIAAAQKLRWAKIKGDAATPSSSATPPKRKRKMSAAGRKAISDATKKRWALKRAADKKTAGKAKSTAAKRAQKKSKTPEAAAAAVA